MASGGPGLIKPVRKLPDQCPVLNSAVERSVEFAGVVSGALTIAPQSAQEAPAERSVRQVRSPRPMISSLATAAANRKLLRPLPK